MKKRKNICIVIIVVAIIIGIILLLSKKTKMENLKYEESNYGYNIFINVPKEKGYNFIKEEQNEEDSDYILKGDKIKILFYNEVYKYQNTLRYMEEYENKEANYTNWKEYIKNTDFSNISSLNLIETTINNRETLRYDFYSEQENKDAINGYIYVFNMDDINTNFNLTIKVLPTKEENYSIEELINDKEIKNIIMSIKIEEQSK